ncbi:hypothetical protein N656DRAFT_47661 [Canariomyces notabilis]|uniref:Uncharacterized protein n=1 Tax=Canariomyces notabilis TaxID=2074819 RepID=A0AAN6TN43_9PEZI|nr:hypothetical protein N656DRAFT_47661 [Canariomyces arenarius]
MMKPSWAPLNHPWAMMPLIDVRHYYCFLRPHRTYIMMPRSIVMMPVMISVSRPEPPIQGKVQLVAVAKLGNRSGKWTPTYMEGKCRQYRQSRRKSAPWQVSQVKTTLEAVGSISVTCFPTHMYWPVWPKLNNRSTAVEILNLPIENCASSHLSGWKKSRGVSANDVLGPSQALRSLSDPGVRGKIEPVQSMSCLGNLLVERAAEGG